jgi:Glycosyl hydrolase family 12
MKHRAKTKRRFWPAVTAAVLIAVAGGGTAVLVRGSGQDGASLAAAAVTPAIRHAQVLAALKHRTKPPARKHKHKNKPKHGHGHGSPLPRPTWPGPKPTSPGTSPTSPTSASTSPGTDPTSPSTGPTSPSSSPRSTSPSANPTGPKNWAWCSSDAFGTFNTSDGFDLYNNKWNSDGNPGPQQICGNSGRDWQVTSTQRAGNTAVLTYPSVQKNYPNRALSSFTSMTSSYAENMNATAGTGAEAAYDIWINDLTKEVMFWVDNHGQTPAGSKVATVTLGGLTWNYYRESGYYAFVLDHNAATGTVDLLAGIKYLMSRGDLSGSDKLWQVNFGFEICSTAGVPETFTVGNFTLAS